MAQRLRIVFFGTPEFAVPTLEALLGAAPHPVVGVVTQPDRPRIFKVPLVPWFPLISILLCGGLMTGLTVITWLRFVVWLGLGLLIYIFYSRHRSEFAKK